MGKSLENKKELDKQAVYQSEYDKLTKIFEEVEESKRKLVEGLISDAAFLYSENYELRKLIKSTGAVVTNPKNPAQQRTVPAATQYLKNANSYAVVIKALNSILSKNQLEPEDDMAEFE